MATIMLHGFQCERCGHKWSPRDGGAEPSVCPKCKSPYWNKPRKNGVSMTQLELPYVPHNLDGQIVVQRQKDGYINATAMCKAAGREFKHYNELKSTKEFLEALEAEVGITTSELIQSLSGGTPTLQGTWVHPQVAIHLAQWCSPKFAVRVSKWVYDWLSGISPTGRGRLPYHLRRYVSNQHNVPHGHFSILNEMTLALVAPLEATGYELPEKLWPDISQGKMFAKYLREQFEIDTDLIPTYTHTFEDGRAAVQAKAYPNSYLATFREHFTEIWLPERAESYFAERDPKALGHLKVALPPPPKKISDRNKN